MNIECIQDDGQQLTPSDPNIDNEDTGKPTLVNAILKDNVAQSDESIDDLSLGSVYDGTNGLYYTNENTEDNKITYYFRGAVENNYVKFAGYYWRIIRINEDSSVRLIYQGETVDATGDETLISKSVFNNKYDDNTYVGYMYGTSGSSTYAETHANISDSTIKTVLDTWYEENLLSYDSYLADVGFCGDRSLASESNMWHPSDTALGYGTNNTYYGAYNRVGNQPQIGCPTLYINNDLYTTSSSSKGNKALDYPIGLITIDEVIYAGGSVYNSNRNYYLYAGNLYWTMSPMDFGGMFPEEASIYVVAESYLNYETVETLSGVRPVVNLKSNVEVSSGDGTQDNPYIIKTNSI